MNNTLIRTLSGIGFIAIMILGLLINKYLFAVLIIFMIFEMMSEFYEMTMGDKFKIPRMFAILAGEILFIILFYIASANLPVKYLYFASLPVLIVMIFSLTLKNKEDFTSFSNIYAGILYISIPMAMSNLVVFDNDIFKGIILLSLFIIIWASDVGAFVFGVTLGQKFGKKLCPSISPKKSWIGAWGGLLCAIIVAIVLNLIHVLPFSLIHCIVISIIIDISGICGDLFESQWKRCCEIKDSGTLIPGHGGILDRFDSTLFAIPAAVMYMIIFNLI